MRFRKSVPDCWLKLTIREGRNRQVRRMTAAIGHPTLRLVRWSIGDWTIEEMQPGEWREVAVAPRERRWGSSLINRKLGGLLVVCLRRSCKLGRGAGWERGRWNV